MYSLNSSFLGQRANIRKFSEEDFHRSSSTFKISCSLCHTKWSLWILFQQNDHYVKRFLVIQIVKPNGFTPIGFMSNNFIRTNPRPIDSMALWIAPYYLLSNMIFP